MTSKSSRPRPSPNEKVQESVRAFLQDGLPFHELPIVAAPWPHRLSSTLRHRLRRLLEHSRRPACVSFPSINSLAHALVAWWLGEGELP